MNLNLVDRRDDSSNFEDSLCLENVEVGQACPIVRCDHRYSSGGIQTYGAGLPRVDELLHGLPRLWIPSREVVIDDRLELLVNVIR